MPEADLFDLITEAGARIEALLSSHPHHVQGMILTYIMSGWAMDDLGSHDIEKRRVLIETIVAQWRQKRQGRLDA